MLSIAPCGGPIKAIFAFESALANLLFSERNPYPGCTAAAPDDLAAETTFSISIYDLFAGEAPM